MNIILTRKDLVYQDDNMPFEEIRYGHFHDVIRIMRTADIVVFIDEDFRSKVFKFKERYEPQS